MSVFRKLGGVWEDRIKVVKIENMNVSSNHLGDEHNIMAFLDKVVSSVQDPTQLSVIIHDFVYQNPRIQKVSFYKCKKNPVAVIFTDISGLKKEKDFTQQIHLSHRNPKCEFTIVELPIQRYYDIQKGSFSLPNGWSVFQEMNKIYNKMSLFFK